MTLEGPAGVILIVQDAPGTTWWCRIYLRLLIDCHCPSLGSLEPFWGRNYIWDAAPGFFTDCDGDKHQLSAGDLGHGVSDILMRHPAWVCVRSVELPPGSKLG